MRRVFILSGFLTIVSIISGCTVSTQDTIAISETANVLEKKLDKVMGDDSEVSKGEIEEFPQMFAILPFTNDSEDHKAPMVLRSVIQGHFSTKNYQFMHWQKVNDLVENLNISSRDIADSPSQVMEQLGVDGAIRGRINEFNRFYVGVYSHITMGVYVEMINLKGEIIWFGQFDVTSRAGGASSTPWGILLNIALATMNLDDESMYAAADELAREVTMKLPEPPYYNAESGPMIASVIHDGGRKPLRYGDVITVGLQGDPDMTASAIIDGLEIVDMRESEPGTYFAEIPVSPRWNEKGMTISARLTNAMGQSNKRLSEVGLVTFDNNAPEQPVISQLSASEGSLLLNIDTSKASGNPEMWKVYGANNEVLLEGKTSTLSGNLTGSTNFEEIAISVVALDAAGNESEPLPLSVVSLPFSEMQNFPVIEQLPAQITTPTVLKSSLPIRLDEKVTITSKGALYIAPNTQFTVAREGYFAVQGALYIYGQHGTVHFEPENETASPKKFFDLATDQVVDIKGARFRGAEVALTAAKGNVMVSDVQFLDNVYSAMMLDGSSSLSVNRAIISGSNTAGIVLSEQSKLAISDSEFRHNEPFHIQNSSIYPVTIRDTKFEPAASNTTILGEVEEQ